MKLLVCQNDTTICNLLNINKSCYVLIDADKVKMLLKVLKSINKGTLTQI